MSDGRSARVGSERNQQLILGAAQQLLIDKGVEFDVRQVASRAGVGLGTIYRTFDSKEVLLRILLDAMAAEFDDIVDRACAIDEARAALIAFAEGLWGFGERYGRSFDLRNALVHDESYMTRADAAWDRVAGVVRRATAAGVIDSTYPTRFVIQVMIGLVEALCVKPWTDEGAAPYSHDLMTSVLLKAMGPA